MRGCQVLRMAAGLAVVAGYVGLRSLLAVDQLVRTFRKVRGRLRARVRDSGTGDACSDSGLACERSTSAQTGWARDEVDLVSGHVCRRQWALHVGCKCHGIVGTRPPHYQFISTRHLRA